jgi:hypothetical protein
MRLLRGSEGLGMKTNDECLKVPAVIVAIFRNVPPGLNFCSFTLMRQLSHRRRRPNLARRARVCALSFWLGGRQGGD